MTKKKETEALSAIKEKLEQIKKLQEECRTIAVKAKVAFSYPAPNQDGIYFSPDRYKVDMKNAKEVGIDFKQFYVDIAGWYSSSDNC